jgi:hypothetical protein
LLIPSYVVSSELYVIKGWRFVLSGSKGKQIPAEFYGTKEALALFAKEHSSYQMSDPGCNKYFLSDSSFASMALEAAVLAQSVPGGGQVPPGRVLVYIPRKNDFTYALDKWRSRPPLIRPKSEVGQNGSPEAGKKASGLTTEKPSTQEQECNLASSICLGNSPLASFSIGVECGENSLTLEVATDGHFKIIVEDGKSGRIVKK